jgi:hypothetical protein
MMIDLWEKKHWEYQKQLMTAKDWKELANKINATFPNEMSRT